MELKEGSLVVRGFVSRPDTQKNLTVLSVAALERDGFDREGREALRYAEYPNTKYKVFAWPTNKRRYVHCWMTGIFTVEFYEVDTVVRDGVIVSDIGRRLEDGFARIDTHTETRDW